jgi:chromosome partitioning protein
MVRKIVVANQKGGVGKTTTVLNLGAALAEQHKRVLLIDLDPQCGLTASLGIDPYVSRRSVYSLLMYDQVALAQTVIHVGGTLAVVPASRDLTSAEAKMGTSRQAVMRLRQAVQKSRLPFDYIIMDTPPSLGVLTANGLLAAEELIITVQCQYLAMRGVRALLETLKHVQAHLHPALNLTGLVATMYQPESLHAREVVQELRTVFPRRTFQTLVPTSEALAEAPITGQSILAYAPGDPAAQAYRTLAREIIDHE